MQVVENILIGGTGYVGSNLARQFDNQSTVQIARRDQPGVKSVLVDLAAEDISENHPLALLQPKRVWYLGRPAELLFHQYRRYHSNLQNLILRWCGYTDLISVHFTSTTMVYSGEIKAQAENENSATAPYGLYEYFKLETELFLECLARTFRPDVEFAAWRLPLVVGGQYDALRHGQQFIYHFIEAYRCGCSWQFDTQEDYRFGTSWVWLDDLVKCWVRHSHREPVGGFSVMNPVSGFSTYHDMHDAFVAHGLGTGTMPLKLHRTRFEVEDNARLQTRGFEEILPILLERHRAIA